MNQNGHAHLPPAEVATSLGEMWVNGEGPLYEKLACALQRAIDDGAAADEQRLREYSF